MDFNPYEVNLAREQSYNSIYGNSTLFLQLLTSLVVQQRRSPRTKDTFKDEYDYIIVGGGAGGSALANRLSEEPCASVLLLECGTHPPILTELPATWQNWLTTDIDYNFLTVPQNHTAQAIKDARLRFPAGKALGGSSTINGMLYTRGNRRNFDDWAAMGAEGWSYDEVLPYFKKFEDNNNVKYVESGYHSAGGPVSVQDQVYIGDFYKKIHKAAEEIGYTIGDCNGAKQSGVCFEQGTTNNAQRCSAAKAYLVPAENRTNLDILDNACVTKVKINPITMRATHVKFSHGGKKHKVRAKREIILSAGTFNTPKLLMLSGVGPAEELQKHNIKVIQDLPVGKNLNSHLATSMDFLLDSKIQIPVTELKEDENIQKYIQSRRGPLASLALDPSLGFFTNSVDVNPTDDFPLHEIYFVEADVSIYKNAYNVPSQYYDAYYKKYENRTIFHCYVSLLQAKSRGTVKLASNDPKDDPVIDPNFLSEEEDVNDFIEALKTCKRFGNSHTFRKKLGAKPYPGYFPGCESYANNEDDYFKCYLRKFIIPTYHPTSTARMGDPSHDDTVVCPKLKVKGIENLRVVDASVMPIVTSANTVAVVYMIAEKAADMIKDDLHRDMQRGIHKCQV